MKKRILSLLLGLLLLGSLLPAAALAEGNIIANMGTVRAGTYLDMQMATTDTGTASLSGGSLPDGCSIVTEEKNGQSAHYLRGTPNVAGTYEFSLLVTDTVTIVPTIDETEAQSDEEGGGSDAEAEPVTETVTIATLTCSLTVLPAVPTYSVKDAECFVGEELRIGVQASVKDSGSLSYQWYSNEIRDNLDGRLLENETGAELLVNTEFPEVSYFYCVITNNNNGVTESQTTPVITVTVSEPVITAVSIASLPEKLEYTEGDTLDSKGLTLFVRYSNGMTVTDDEGFTLSPTKLETPGTQSITINYRDNICSFPVIVNEAKETVEGIAVATLPVKREYKVGEAVDTQGLVLQVITNKGNRSEVSTGFTCSPQVLETAGVQTVTISYEGQTTSFTVTVVAGEKTVKSIEIETLPTKLTYQVGDSFDPSGMVLKVVTDQGDELVRGGFSCSPSRFTREGTQTITVSYSGQTCTMELVVSPAPEEPSPEPTPAQQTPVTEKPRPSAAPSGDNTPDRHGSRLSNTTIVVILIAALLALAALLAFAYVYQKDIRALWNKLTRKKRK